MSWQHVSAPLARVLKAMAEQAEKAEAERQRKAKQEEIGAK